MMQRIFTGPGKVAACVAAAVSCFAVAGPTIADQPGTNLQEGTPVRVAIDRTIKSGADKAGEPLRFEVSEDVYDANHTLVIPKGAEADGVILQSSRRGMFGRAGKLKFTCDYVVAGNGIHVPLRNDPVLVRGHDNRGAANGGAAVGVILFAPIAVVGVFVNGRDITVNQGTVFTMYVDKSTAVPEVSPAG